MQVINGQYNQAHVYADYADQTALDQIQSIMNHPVSAGMGRIAVMPDTHAGKGSVIGFTAEIRDRVCPNIVGVDIGCSIVAVQLDVDHIDFDQLDRVIHECVPAGNNVFASVQDVANHATVTQWMEGVMEELHADVSAHCDYYIRSLGTLGSGNHFIEVDRDSAGRYWLVVHSGSRRLGVDVCNYYMSSTAAEERLNDSRNRLIDAFKTAGAQRSLSTVLQQFDVYRGMIRESFNDPMHYVEGDELRNYLHDMELVQNYAQHNVQEIVNRIVRAMHWKVVDLIRSVHNYIDTKQNILRKGAIDASEGCRVLIPINMAFGTIIGTGLGNKEMNCSAPHGAGRLLARGESRRQLTVDQFQQSMKGIYTTCVGESTLDESPAAYKSFDQIEHYLRETVRIDDIIKPVYNFKAS